jgi:hypothetical protein
MIDIRRVAVALATATAVAVLGACSSDVTGTAVPDADAIADTTTPAPIPSTTRSAAPSTPDVDLEVDVRPGDCIALGGTVEDATIDYADCGSSTANYEVVNVVETTAECPSDVDMTYYESFGGVEVGALCLDIDWQIGDCMDLGGEDPQRIDCSETAIAGEKATEILPDTTDVNDCAISEGGFVYNEREFVVCTDSF